MSNYPKLETLEDYENDWEKYIEAIYEIFKNDFIYSSPTWSPDQSKVGINSTPMSQNKEFTFWHITSEGKVEEERTPDLRRCERIRFPKHLIDKFPGNSIYAWEKDVKKGRNGGREKRVHIATTDFSYLVVISPNKSGKRRLITAFYVKQGSNRKRLEGDYNKSLSKNFSLFKCHHRKSKVA